MQSTTSSHHNQILNLVPIVEKNRQYTGLIAWGHFFRLYFPSSNSVEVKFTLHHFVVDEIHTSQLPASVRYT